MLCNDRMENRYAGGPKEIIASMKTVQSQSTSNPSSISQIAATEAINGSQVCVEKMVIEYKKEMTLL